MPASAARLAAGPGSVAAPGLLGRLRSRALGLIAAPGFQRWAMRSPLTAWVARREAAALFDVTAGFVYSQVLAACVRLRLLECLRDGPVPLPALAMRLGLDSDAAERLVRAASALRLVTFAQGNVRLALRGAALLGNPGALAMIAHHDRLYRDLADPVALLRHEAESGAVAAYWPYAAGESEAAVAPYSALMAASNAMVADQLLAAFNISAHKHLLDIGGGEGAFLIAAAAAAPDLRLTLFDLPAVAARASARLGAAGLAGRATAVGGDFTRDSLPAGADLITLLRVVHDHEDDTVMTLLRQARAAIAPDGTLLLAEPMRGGGAVGRMADAYFGFYLLAMGSGRARDAETLCAMLRAAGFSRAQRLRTRAPLLTGLIVARA